MAVFDRNDPTHFLRIDWQILQNGATCLYQRNELEAVCQWFKQHDYDLYHFDCTQWQTEQDIYAEMISVFHIPATNDFYDFIENLTQRLEELDYPPDGGIALVFWQFDIFNDRLPEFVYMLLHSIERTARTLLLIGLRLIILLHSENRQIQLNPVFCHDVAAQFQHPF